MLLPPIPPKTAKGPALIGKSLWSQDEARNDDVQGAGARDLTLACIMTELAFLAGRRTDAAASSIREGCRNNRWRLFPRLGGHSHGEPLPIS
jgi:hypothetical protein